MTSDSINTTFVIECCREDYCNRGLKPQLHPRNKEGTVCDAVAAIIITTTTTTTLESLCSNNPVFLG
ncbi:hypothetical protein TSAR_009362 [Trichomalopsis sarcophagae]|uniref:Activin types I and II receptor domain-containing protein n=1 Tax=Trichomalopsis sarcophagae TaxID=543379 RepID=A0A232EGZ4_9HYME|nr:hypothetical protein TSAR_009362 [Trichomalopsis sarcophagae]